MPFYLHPCDPHDMPHMYRGHPELLGATWSWTVETTTHALRMVFGGTFDRFPGVTLVLGHMGETVPYLLWRLDSRTRIQARAGRGQRRLPSEVIRKNIADHHGRLRPCRAALCPVRLGRGQRHVLRRLSL